MKFMKPGLLKALKAAARKTEEKDDAKDVTPSINKTTRVSQSKTVSTHKGVRIIDNGLNETGLNETRKTLFQQEPSSLTQRLPGLKAPREVPLTNISAVTNTTSGSPQKKKGKRVVNNVNGPQMTISSSSFPIPMRGIQNGRNTCFANSIFFILFPCLPLLSSYSSHSASCKRYKEHEFCAYCIISKVRDEWINKGAADSAYCPREFWNNMWQFGYDGRFRRGDESDAQEFFQCLLDSLLEHSATDQERERFLNFRWSLCSTIEAKCCQSNKTIPVSGDTNLILPVAIPIISVECDNELVIFILQDDVSDFEVGQRVEASLLDSSEYNGIFVVKEALGSKLTCTPLPQKESANLSSINKAFQQRGLLNVCSVDDAFSSFFKKEQIEDPWIGSDCDCPRRCKCGRTKLEKPVPRGSISDNEKINCTCGCGFCHLGVDASKRITISHVPSFCVLTLKRIIRGRRDGVYQEVLQTHIEFPETIQIATQTRILCAVVVYSGVALFDETEQRWKTSGHYYSFVKINNQWYKYNDANDAELVSWDTVKNSKAYMLLYVDSTLSSEETLAVVNNIIPDPPRPHRVYASEGLVDKQVPQQKSNALIGSSHSPSRLGQALATSPYLSYNSPRRKPVESTPTRSNSSGTSSAAAADGRSSIVGLIENLRTPERAGANPAVVTTPPRAVPPKPPTVPPKAQTTRSGQRLLSLVLGLNSYPVRPVKRNSVNMHANVSKEPQPFAIVVDTKAGTMSFARNGEALDIMSASDVNKKCGHFGSSLTHSFVFDMDPQPLPSDFVDNDYYFIAFFVPVSISRKKAEDDTGLISIIDQKEKEPPNCILLCVKVNNIDENNDCPVYAFSCARSRFSQFRFLQNFRLDPSGHRARYFNLQPPVPAPLFDNDPRNNLSVTRIRSRYFLIFPAYPTENALESARIQTCVPANQSSYDTEPRSRIETQHLPFFPEGAAQEFADPMQVYRILEHIAADRCIELFKTPTSTAKPKDDDDTAQESSVLTHESKFEVFLTCLSLLLGAYHLNSMPLRLTAKSLIYKTRLNQAERIVSDSSSTWSDKFQQLVPLGKNARGEAIDCILVLLVKCLLLNEAGANTIDTGKIKNILKRSGFSDNDLNFEPLKSILSRPQGLESSVALIDKFVDDLKELDRVLYFMDDDYAAYTRPLNTRVNSSLSNSFKRVHAQMEALRAQGKGPALPILVGWKPTIFPRTPKQLRLGGTAVSVGDFLTPVGNIQGQKLYWGVVFNFVTRKRGKKKKRAAPAMSDEDETAAHELKKKKQEKEEDDRETEERKMITELLQCALALTFLEYIHMSNVSLVSVSSRHKMSSYFDREVDYSILKELSDGSANENTYDFVDSLHASFHQSLRSDDKKIEFLLAAADTLHEKHGYKGIPVPDFVHFLELFKVSLEYCMQLIGLVDKDTALETDQALATLFVQTYGAKIQTGVPTVRSSIELASVDYANHVNALRSDKNGSAHVLDYFFLLDEVAIKCGGEDNGKLFLSPGVTMAPSPGRIPLVGLPPNLFTQTQRFQTRVGPCLPYYIAFESKTLQKHSNNVTFATNYDKDGEARKHEVQRIRQTFFAPSSGKSAPLSTRKKGHEELFDLADKHSDPKRTFESRFESCFVRNLRDIRRTVQVNDPSMINDESTFSFKCVSLFISDVLQSFVDTFNTFDVLTAPIEFTHGASYATALMVLCESYATEKYHSNASVLSRIRIATSRMATLAGELRFLFGFFGGRDHVNKYRLEEGGYAAANQFGLTAFLRHFLQTDRRSDSFFGQHVSTREKAPLYLAMKEYVSKHGVPERGVSLDPFCASSATPEDKDQLRIRQQSLSLMPLRCLLLENTNKSLLSRVLSNAGHRLYRESVHTTEREKREKLSDRADRVRKAAAASLTFEQARRDANQRRKDDAADMKDEDDEEEEEEEEEDSDDDDDADEEDFRDRRFDRSRAAAERGRSRRLDEEDDDEEDDDEVLTELTVPESKRDTVKEVESGDGTYPTASDDVPEYHFHVAVGGKGSKKIQEANDIVHKDNLHLQYGHKWKQGHHVSLANGKHGIVLSNEKDEDEEDEVCFCGSRTGVWTIQNGQGDCVYAVDTSESGERCVELIDGRMLKRYIHVDLVDGPSQGRRTRAQLRRKFTSVPTFITNLKPKDNNEGSGEEAELSDF
jgi:hypothetical protein